MKRFREALKHLLDTSHGLSEGKSQLVTTLYSLQDNDSDGDVERILQARAKAIRENQLKIWGYKRREHWDKSGPINLDKNREPWVDHPYRLYRDGKKWYVSEPYNLDSEGCAALANLEERGWDVHITSWQATHFPGHTLAIWITSNHRLQHHEQHHGEGAYAGSTWDARGPFLGQSRSTSHRLLVMEGSIP